MADTASGTNVSKLPLEPSAGKAVQPNAPVAHPAVRIINVRINI